MVLVYVAVVTRLTGHKAYTEFHRRYPGGARLRDQSSVSGLPPSAVGGFGEARRPARPRGIEDAARGKPAGGASRRGQSFRADHEVVWVFGEQQ
eukprot:COSAG02_NODE_5824_length_4012_cov_59.380199_4_plen_94_part_00